MPQTIKPTPEKFCEICGERMTRKRYGKRLEDRGVFLRRRRCSQSCANARIEVTKSAHHWRAQKHKADSCSICQATQNLHVHHIDRDTANNTFENLQTLCASCHLKLHWKEDRDARMKAASRGGLTQKRLRAGSES